MWCYALINERVERVCMNPDCKDCDILRVYKCSTDRPIVYIAKTCWNCGKSEFLE